MAHEKIKVESLLSIFQVGPMLKFIQVSVHLKVLGHIGHKFCEDLADWNALRSCFFLTLS